jgi:hypothetical protein
MRSEMTNTPPLNRLIFALFLLAVLAVGAAALIWPSVRAFSYAPVRDSLLPDFYLDPSARIPVRLTVAVTPRLEDWMKRAASEYSHEHNLVTIDVTPLRDSDAGRSLSAMSGLPDVWIAETEWSRVLTGGVPYQTDGVSLARDGLVWIVAAVRPEFAQGIDWLTIGRAAADDPLFRIALPPLDHVEGMAACYSAAAEYHGRNDITAADISDPGFAAWLGALRRAAPDLSRNPRDQLASRPPQVDAGLILRSDLTQLDLNAFRTQSPGTDVPFRFPLYLRSRWENVPAAEAEARSAAAESFRDFLTDDARQDGLAEFGLERAAVPDSSSLSPDEATVRALQFCWQ